MAVRVVIPDAAGLEYLAELPDSVSVDVWSGPDAPPATIAQADFLIPPGRRAEDALRHVERFSRLRVVQLLSAGYDNVPPYLPSGVTLCNARGVYDVAVAEWTLSVVLASVRLLPLYWEAQERAAWTRFPADTLFGKNILIVGYGSIGRAVEQRLLPFGVQVRRIASVSRPADAIESPEVLNDALRKADVVVILVPLTAETTALVDGRFLGQMKEGALLVNASRGPVVDSDALASELQSGRIRAALDVTDPEPLPSDHALWTCPSLILTPHVAGYTTMGTPLAYALAREQIERYVSGRPLRNIVAGPSS